MQARYAARIASAAGVYVMTMLTTRSFVGTILHPVFITSDATSKIEVRRDPDSGRTTVTRSGVITQYLHVPPYRGVAHDGQPTWQVSPPSGI